MATMNVKDSAGATVEIEKPLTPGRAAAASSRPVALSTEDKTALDALATQTTLAAVLAKIIAAPATEAKQDTVIASLASILAKLIAAPATEAKQDTANTLLAAATPAGTNIMGRVGIDQTTPGTTDKVTAVGNVASAATDSGNPVKVGGVNNTSPPTLTDGQRGNLQLGTRGALLVTIMDSNGTAGTVVNSAGADAVSNSRGGVQVYARAENFNGSTWDRLARPNATSRIVSAAATTNPTSAKAAAGNLHKVSGYNAKASAVYLKFYNKASAPTVGTDTPVLTIYLPATAAFNFDFGNAGLYFATGIAYGLTSDGADNGTTALSSGDILGLNVLYS